MTTIQAPTLMGIEDLQRVTCVGEHLSARESGH